jgi:16S rRNA (guanine527-N7)-methyltransferase
VTRAGDQGDRARALQLTPVSRETEADLEVLVAELTRWQQAKNLVSPATLDQVWTRHIADSLQLFALAATAKRWLDLGSGGGFPGLVLGICLKQTGGHIDLVESNARKCAFLRHAARVTGAPVRVHQRRIEEAMPHFIGQVDVVTARALAPLSDLLGWCKELLRTGTLGLFPKGEQLDAELTDSSRYWRIQASTVPSKTEASARILLVRSAEPRTDP